MNIPAIRKAVSALGLICLSSTALAAPEYDLGKKDFSANCAICNGTNGQGNGPFNDLLVLPAPDLRQMPIWGNYYTLMPLLETDDYSYNSVAYVRSRIVALIDYLNRIQGN
jgi:hypothetical protein